MACLRRAPLGGHARAHQASATGGQRTRVDLKALRSSQAPRRSKVEASRRDGRRGQVRESGPTQCGTGPGRRDVGGIDRGARRQYRRAASDRGWRRRAEARHSCHASAFVTARADPPSASERELVLENGYAKHEGKLFIVDDYKLMSVASTRRWQSAAMSWI